MEEIEQGESKSSTSEMIGVVEVNERSRVLNLKVSKLLFYYSSSHENINFKRLQVVLESHESLPSSISPSWSSKHLQIVQ